MDVIFPETLTRICCLVLHAPRDAAERVMALPSLTASSFDASLNALMQSPIKPTAPPETAHVIDPQPRPSRSDAMSLIEDEDGETQEAARDE